MGRIENTSNGIVAGSKLLVNHMHFTSKFRISRPALFLPILVEKHSRDMNLGFLTDPSPLQTCNSGGVGGYIRRAHIHPAGYAEGGGQPHSLSSTNRARFRDSRCTVSLYHTGPAWERSKDQWLLYFSGPSNQINDPCSNREGRRVDFFLPITSEQ